MLISLSAQSISRAVPMMTLALAVSIGSAARSCKPSSSVEYPAASSCSLAFRACLPSLASAFSVSPLAFCRLRRDRSRCLVAASARSRAFFSASRASLDSETAARLNDSSSVVLAICSALAALTASSSASLVALSSRDCAKDSSLACLFSLSRIFLTRCLLLSVGPVSFWTRSWKFASSGELNLSCLAKPCSAHIVPASSQAS